MSIIQEERISQGLTQTDLAARLGVSPSAVSQAEKAENDGTITLATLGKFLSVLGRVPAVIAAPSTEIVPVRWDPGTDWPVDIDGAQHAILDAKYGDRIPTIVGECVALGIPLTVEDLWLVADRTTVATSLDVWNRASRVRDTYDRLLSLVAADRWVPALALPDGRRVPPPATDDPAAVWSWAFTGIRNGADWLDAIRAASAILVQTGRPWPILPARLEFRHVWESAVGKLRSVGNPDPVGSLLLRATRRDM